MKTYTAKAVRSGDWWAISVPDVPGVHTQAKRLDRAEDMARDALALFLDIPEESIDVVVDAELPDDARQLVERTKALRTEADRVMSEANASTTDSVMALHSTLHLTHRDTAKILGLSFQRTQQIAKEAASHRRRMRRVSKGRGNRAASSAGRRRTA
jgi:predicted RNase H-like HicB family nuclease